jgi:hypothetical protein
MRTPVLRSLATGLAATALALSAAACGGDDGVTKADMEEYLRGGGFGEAQASCVTDRLFDDLDEDQLLAVYEADEGDELEPAIGEAVEAASAACAGEG